MARKDPGEDVTEKILEQTGQFKKESAPVTVTTAVDAQTEFIDEIKRRYEEEKGELLEEARSLRHKNELIEQEKRHIEQMAKTQPMKEEPDPQRSSVLDEGDELFSNMGEKKKTEMAALFKLMRQVMSKETDESSSIDPNASIPEALGIDRYLEKKDKRQREESLDREKKAEAKLKEEKQRLEERKQALDEESKKLAEDKLSAEKEKQKQTLGFTHNSFSVKLEGKKEEEKKKDNNNNLPFEESFDESASLKPPTGGRLSTRRDLADSVDGEGSLDFSLTQTQGDFSKFPLPGQKPISQSNRMKPDEGRFTSHGFEAEEEIEEDIND